MICFARNGRSGKGFLLTSKVCPQGVFCSYLGAIYMYKIIKNVSKIRFRRDHFETCNMWVKRKAFLLSSKFCTQNFVPNGLSAHARGYIHMVKHEKNVFKIGLQSTFFLPATNGQSDKGFLLTSIVCPQGLSALAQGLHTYIKSSKMCIKSDFVFSSPEPKAHR